MRTELVCLGYICFRSIRGDTPHVACLSFPVVDQWPTAQSDIFQSEDGFPFGGIQVLGAWLRPFGGPLEAEVPGGGRGNTECGVVPCVLPPLTGWGELFDGIEEYTVVAGLDQQTLTLYVCAAGLYLNVAHQRWLIEGILQPTGVIGTIDPLGIDGHLRGIGQFCSTSHCAHDGVSCALGFIHGIA